MRLGPKIAIAILLGLVAVHFTPLSTGEDPGRIPPILQKGLIVLILDETSDHHKMPTNQLDAVNGNEFRDYVRTHCARDDKGSVEFRFWDKDLKPDVLTTEPQILQDAFNKAKSNPPPWLIVSNGNKGCSVPLPADGPSIMKKVKQYGGE